MKCVATIHLFHYLAVESSMNLVSTGKANFPIAKIPIQTTGIIFVSSLHT